MQTPEPTEVCRGIEANRYIHLRRAGLIVALCGARVESLTDYDAFDQMCATCMRREKEAAK